MSEKTGWLFSVGRIFSGSKDREVNGKSSKTSPKTTTSSPKALETATFLKDVVSLEGEGTSQSPSQVKRNATLRYLSPTIADRSSRRTITNGLESSEDIFNSPLLAKRKRQMTDSDSLFLVNVTGNAAKRSKSVANRSLLEQPSQKSQGALTRHDTTWSGGLSASHSPASSVTSFSLLSKQSVPKSNGSDLSTSTMRILKQLEKVQTPAREIQRMPMIRTANRVGTWAEGPPLKKAVDATPSRIQLLSKTMGISARRKPYWQDLTRKRSEKTTVDGVEAIPNGSSDLDKTANDPSVTTVPEKSLSSTESGKKHQSVLKGSDGKSIGLNTFNAASLDDFEPVSKSWMNNVKPIADKTAAPASGFLSTLSFSFTAPTQVTAESIIAVKKNAESKVSDDSDSDGSETSVGEKDSGSDSDDSDSDSDTEKAPKKTDASRPQTSTDTVSDGATPASSKNSSPAGETNKVAVAVTTTAKNWDCPECFTNWPQDKESCGCCGYNKSGSSSKKLVSTLDLTASKPPATTVKFGFGASAPVSNTPAAPAQSLFEFSKPVSSSIPPFGSKPAEKEKEEPKVEKPKETTVLAASAAADWSCPDCFVQNKATSEKCVCCSHVNAAAAAPPRAAWGCPDCMVTNKAECDNCVCCGYAMYKTAGSEKKSNSVFGDRAFKPNTAAPAGVSFGFGKPADANKTAAPAVKFGFGTGPAPVKAEEKKEEPVKPAAVFSIGKPEETVTDGAKTEKPEEKKPLFGTSTSTAPLFGSGSLFGGSVSKPAEAPAPAAASETVSKSTVFAFGKPDAPAKIEVVQTAAPAAAPLFGSSTVSFGAPTATAAQAPAPAVVPPTAASQPTSTPFSFGSTSNSSSGLFGSSSAATTSSTPFVFGSTTAAAPAPAAPVAAPAPAPVAPAPLSFGSFGTSTATAAPATTNLFGAAPAATSSAPSGGLFGSSSTPSISTGLFGSSSTTAASSIAPASNNTTSLFGNAQSSAPLFGAPEAKKSMFGTSETAAQPVAPMFGSFGASTTTNNAFNFGSTAAPAGDVFKFGSSSSSTSAAPAPVFQFGQPPAPIPTLSTSSSTNSMFNLPTEAPKEFNFGAPPASDGGAFQFGAASSGSLFNPGPPTSVPGLRSNTATRKMAVARRRRQ